MPEVRFVVDDSSVSADERTYSELQSSLEGLNAQLGASRRLREDVGIISGLFSCISKEQLTFGELLGSQDIDRDTRLLSLSFLLKCVFLDSENDFFVDPEIEISGQAFSSFAVSFAVNSVQDATAVGVFTIFRPEPRGLVSVTTTNGSVPIHFVVDHPTRLGFYRSIFDLENVPESSFFQVAERAFPDLKFVQGISFSQFRGSYAALRSTVVNHLGCLNDRFQAAFEEHNGIPNEVSVVVGIDLSLESVKTRSSEKLMAFRDVDCEGKVYRCEWHSKLERNRNRIHFCPSEEGTDGRVLIGLFCEHLPTK